MPICLAVLEGGEVLGFRFDCLSSAECLSPSQDSIYLPDGQHELFLVPQLEDAHVFKILDADVVTDAQHGSVALGFQIEKIFLESFHMVRDKQEKRLLGKFTENAFLGF